MKLDTLLQEKRDEIVRIAVGHGAQSIRCQVPGLAEGTMKRVILICS